MGRSLGTIVDVVDRKPEEIEVEDTNPKVDAMRVALQDTGTVKVRNPEGRVRFYCLTVREYRRLKALDTARE